MFGPTVSPQLVQSGKGRIASDPALLNLPRPSTAGAFSVHGKKLLLTSIAALFLATGAANTPLMVLELPPLEYDHPYKGDLVIIDDVKWQERQDRCGSNSDPQGRWYVACIAPPQPDKCVVFMPDRATLALVFSIHQSFTYKNLLRHEIGHCNGWPGNHAGGRSLFDDPDVLPTPPEPNILPRMKELK